MGRVEIRIPHVTWREGRPRFIPGRHLRALGYRGRDLRHEDRAGRPWFGLEEAIAWARALEEEVAGRKARKAAGQRLPRLERRDKLVTVADLLDQLMNLPELREVADAAERERTGVRSPKTIRWYGAMKTALEKYDAELVASPAASITPKIAKGLHRRLAAEKGLTMARGIIAVLRRAFAERDGVPNPFERLRVTTPPPRLRVGEIEEMEALIAAADRLGRHDVGDAIMMGLVTGQRQNDRLRLVESARIDGDIVFRQSKTKAVVTVPALSQLTLRLDAAKVRRAKASRKLGFAEVLIDEHLWRPWPEEDDGDSYRKAFARVRDVAIAGIVDEAATAAARTEHEALGLNEEPPTVWSLAPCPSLKGFRDQDLRDTAVTWLARAGCTIPEICSVTGHTEAAATGIMKHYLGRHPEMAKRAMAKLKRWLDAKGTSL